MSHLRLPSRTGRSLLRRSVIASCLLLLGAAPAAWAQAAGDTPPAPPLASPADPAVPPVPPRAGPRGVPPVPPTPPVAPDASAAITATGTIARWLTNPDGDVDGMLLNDGTQVSFPPHLSAKVTDAVKPKDAVQLSGWRDGGVFRAATIRGAANGRSVRDDGPPAEPPAPHDPAALKEMSASGRVATLLRGPRGEVNGVVLDSGEQVRFPPHVGARYATLLQRGSTLSARGYGTRNAFGTAFEATALGDSASSLREVFAAPRPPADGGPPAPPATPPVRPAS